MCIYIYIHICTFCTHLFWHVFKKKNCVSRLNSDEKTSKDIETYQRLRPFAVALAVTPLSQALETYAKKRTHDGKGVTIPSQIRPLFLTGDARSCNFLSARNLFLRCLINTIQYILFSFEQSVGHSGITCKGTARLQRIVISSASIIQLVRINNLLPQFVTSHYIALTFSIFH